MSNINIDSFKSISIYIFLIIKNPQTRKSEIVLHGENGPKVAGEEKKPKQKLQGKWKKEKHWVRD